VSRAVPEVGKREFAVNTKVLMVSSAAVTAMVGVSLSFAPVELLHYFGLTGNLALPVLLQIAGASFLGFAILNWTAKDSTIGGIYNRPLALGNFLHFGAGAIAVAKWVMAGQMQVVVAAGGVVYAALAVGFGVVLFASRSSEATASDAKRGSYARAP
jgi:hypothetical protein